MVVLVVPEAERVAADEGLNPGQLVKSTSIVWYIVVVNVGEWWLAVAELVGDLAVVWIDPSQLEISFLFRIVLVAFAFSLAVSRRLYPLFVSFRIPFVLLVFVLALIFFLHDMGSSVAEVDLLDDVELLLVEHVLEDLAVILLQVLEYITYDFVATFDMDLVHDYLLEVEEFLGLLLFLICFFLDFALLGLLLFSGFFLAL